MSWYSVVAMTCSTKTTAMYQRQPPPPKVTLSIWLMPRQGRSFGRPAVLLPQAKISKQTVWLTVLQAVLPYSIATTMVWWITFMLLIWVGKYSVQTLKTRVLISLALPLSIASRTKAWPVYSTSRPQIKRWLIAFIKALPSAFSVERLVLITASSLPWWISSQATAARPYPYCVIIMTMLTEYMASSIMMWRMRAYLPVALPNRCKTSQNPTWSI